ncbi:MAG: RNase P modulator RnpM [Chloroflexota bacterium]
MAKHVPLRSCVACRETKPKRELVRVVRPPEGEEPIVRVDRTGKMNGRGAYLCPAIECWEAAQKKRALNRALQTTLSAENWAELLGYARSTLPGRKVPSKVPAAVGQ